MIYATMLEPFVIPSHSPQGCTHSHDNQISSLLLSLCAVHGFDKASYNVIEGSNSETKFSLNVKGETTLLGAVTGEINSQAGGTTRKLMLIILLVSCMECFGEFEHKQ